MSSILMFTPEKELIFQMGGSSNKPELEFNYARFSIDLLLEPMCSMYGNYIYLHGLNSLVNVGKDSIYGAFDEAKSSLTIF